MENTKLDDLIADIEYAKKCLQQSQLALRNGALTDLEKKSNEGVHFGSALYKLMRDIETASQSLMLLKVYRDPEANKEFIEKLHQYEDPDHNYSGSICPPKDEENTN